MLLIHFVVIKLSTRIIGRYLGNIVTVSRSVSRTKLYTFTHPNCRLGWDYFALQGSKSNIFRIFVVDKWWKSYDSSEQDVNKSRLVGGYAALSDGD